MKNENKRKLFEAFLNNESPERVPVAFWHHFVSFRDHHRAIEDPSVLDAVYAGQKAYLERYKPDMVKIMSDGFFGHPAMLKEPIEDIEAIKRIESCGPDHPFIEKQVKYVQDISNIIDKKVYTYYNLFTPLNYIRLKFEEYDKDMTKFARLFLEDPVAMYEAAERIAADILPLIDRLFAETKIDGIYYSVQAVQDKRADQEFHEKYVRPLDLLLLNKIKEHTDNIILHICGWGDFTNNLNWYVDYPAKVFNWATHNENVSIAEGKKLFNNQPVLGGFDNNPGTLLYSGTKEEIQAEVKKILDEAGTKGVAIGSDCTISEDFDPARIEWIKEAVRNYQA